MADDVSEPEKVKLLTLALDEAFGPNDIPDDKETRELRHEVRYRAALKKAGMADKPALKRLLLGIAFDSFCSALRGGLASKLLLAEATDFIDSQYRAFAAMHGATFDGAEGAASDEAMAIDAFLFFESAVHQDSSSLEQFQQDAKVAEWFQMAQLDNVSVAEIAAYDSYFQGQAKKGNKPRTYAKDRTAQMTSRYGKTKAEHTTVRKIREILRKHGVLARRPAGRPKTRK